MILDSMRQVINSSRGVTSSPSARLNERRVIDTSSSGTKPRAGHQGANSG